jgi:hypothetical protein
VPGRSAAAHSRCATRDALIRDKIRGGDWQATWAKALAVRQCRRLGPAAHRQAGRHAQRRQPGHGAGQAHRQGRRAAGAQGRGHGHAHDGRAVCDRRDHCRGAGQRPPPGRRAFAIPTTCWARPH